MPETDPREIFTSDVLQNLLPRQRSDEFFEALYGDATEGVYDISLALADHGPTGKILAFELQLHERPGKCLACNLTYGLPPVFCRHPVINIQGMVDKITALLGNDTQCMGWELGRTTTRTADLHVIPLTIRLG